MQSPVPVPTLPINQKLQGRACNLCFNKPSRRSQCPLKLENRYPGSFPPRESVSLKLSLRLQSLGDLFPKATPRFSSSALQGMVLTSGEGGGKV